MRAIAVRSVRVSSFAGPIECKCRKSAAEVASAHRISDGFTTGSALMLKSIVSSFNGPPGDARPSTGRVWTRCTGSRSRSEPRERGGATGCGCDCRATASLHRRELVSSAHSDHLHPARGAPVVRRPRKLRTNGAGDWHGDHGRVNHGPHHVRLLAQPGERIHHGNQRRDPDSLAVLLAVLSDQFDLDRLQVRAPCGRTPFVEPVELRRQCRALSGSCHRVASQHSVGQYPVADGRDLDSGIGDRLASWTTAHQRHVRGLVPAAVAGTQRDHWNSVARERRTHYRPDVSAVHFLHGHRPEDNGPLDVGTMCRRLPGGAPRNPAPARGGCLRAVLRAVPGWTGGVAARDVAGIERPTLQYSDRVLVEELATSNCEAAESVVAPAAAKSRTCRAGYLLRRRGR